MKNILIRSLSGAVFIIAILGSLWMGYYYAVALFALIAAGATGEFYSLIAKQGKPDRSFGIFTGLLAVPTGALWIAGSTDNRIIAAYLFLLLLIPVRGIFAKSKTVAANVSLTLAGILYPALPLLSLLACGMVEGKFNLLIPTSVFILVWINDTGAFLTGSGIGRHKLYPRISPNKTWEGSIGGGVFTLIGAWVLHYFFGLFELSQWLTMAVIISVFSNLGDLFESLLKRQAGKKDSGNIMPGHGGILDRFDAVFMAAPAVLIYLILMK